VQTVTIMRLFFVPVSTQGLQGVGSLAKHQSTKLMRQLIFTNE